MKLLFDENLSPKLTGLLGKQFPDSVHVRDCGLKGRSDEEIWDYARTRDFIIVSKDSDFQQRGFLFGYPPKIVWLRIGNCTRDQVVHLLSAHVREIQDFVENSLESTLVLS